jgi:MFS family permease
MRYWVLSWLCGIALIGYVQRLALSVPAGVIQQELGLDPYLMGLVMGAWYVGYAITQIPCGWLADRWGSRPALACCALGWSLLTGLTACAFGFWSLLVLWLLMGLAQAGMIPCAAKAIGGWFGDAQRSFASGMLVCSMAAGTAVAPALSAWLLEAYTWQSVLVLYTVPGVLWVVAFWLLTPPAPPLQTAQAIQQPLPPIDWHKLATSFPMQLLCLQQFLRAAAMVFFQTWFPRFLQETRGVTQQASGELAMWVGIGAFWGGLSGGFTSDALLRATGKRRLSRQGVAVASMVSCAVLVASSAFIPDTETALLFISFGAFCGTFGGVVAYAVTIDFGGRQVGTVFSVMNMSGNIGAALFPPVVGWLVSSTGQWDMVLFLFAGIFIADAVCWAFLNPQRPLFEESQG